MKDSSRKEARDLIAAMGAQCELRMRNARTQRSFGNTDNAADWDRSAQSASRIAFEVSAVAA